MREMSIREANKNFSQVIAAAEQGETIVITKNGRPVAKIMPQPSDRSADPDWQAAYEAMAASLRRKPAGGYRLGTITDADKYG
jgi:prevent-host-death family protein